LKGNERARKRRRVDSASGLIPEKEGSEELEELISLPASLLMVHGG